MIRNKGGKRGNQKTPEGVYAGCVGVRITGMLNGNGKLSSDVCWRDGDVLLRTNTLEDELHTGGSFATQNQTCTQYYHHIWSSSLKFWSVYVLFIKIFGSKIRTLFFLLIIFIEVEKKIRSRLTEIPWSFPGKLL